MKKVFSFVAITAMTLAVASCGEAEEVETDATAGEMVEESQEEADDMMEEAEEMVEEAQEASEEMIEEAEEMVEDAIEGEEAEETEEESAE